MNLKSLANVALCVAVLGVSAFLNGCGTSCGDLCDKSKNCTGAKIADCDSYCSKIEDLNDKANCGDKYDDLLSCSGDQDDICSTSAAAACASQSKAYSACLTVYCAGHAADCAGIAG